MADKFQAEEAILVNEPRRLPERANCGNCFYGRIGPGPDGKINMMNRICFEGPPSTITIPQQVQQMNRATGQIETVMAIQVQTVFPTMQHTQRCHHWAPQDKDVEAGIGLIGGKIGAKAN